MGGRAVRRRHDHVMLATGQLLEARAAARARRRAEPAGRAGPAHGPATGRGWSRRGPGGRRRTGRSDRWSAPARSFRSTVDSCPAATLDEAALTGEPLPVERPAGDEVRSGVVNAGPPIDLIGDGGRRPSPPMPAWSGSSSRPRRPPRRSCGLADRFASCSSRSPWCWRAWHGRSAGPGPRGRRAGRRHAVPAAARRTDRDHVRTVPCARTSASSSRAAVLWSGSPPGDVMLFDKTGTLTHGQPRSPTSSRRATGGRRTSVLRLAASLDQVSPHVLASSIVPQAARRGLPLEHARATCTRNTGTASGAESALTRSGWARPPGSSVTPARVGATGASPRRPGRLADGLRRDRRRAGRGIAAPGPHPARRAAHGPRAARAPG